MYYMSDVAATMAAEKEEYESAIRLKKERDEIIESLEREIEYYEKKGNVKKKKEAIKMLKAIKAS